MIPVLPELPASPLPSAAAPTLPGLVGTGDGGGRPALDFAEVLDAVLPGAAQTLPQGSADRLASAPGEQPPVRPTLPVLKIAASPLPATLPPSGTSLPDSGSALPPAEPAALSERQVQPPFVALAIAPARPAATIVGEPETGAPGLSDEAPCDAGPEVALLALIPAAIPAPPAAPPAATLPAHAPARTDGAADPTRPVRIAAPALEATHLPALPPEPAGEEEAPVSPAPAGDASDAAPRPASATPAPAAPQPAAPALAPPAPSAVPAPMAEHAEPRSLAPQQESAIAQVGEIREALRSARPEMTLRHAEFGFVSLRLEGTTAAPQDWRAVLASRDPGFVPAIQAALAERTVSASADTAATGNGVGGNGAGQNGSSSSSSDQRYGFSQGWGQGSSSPYPGHSGHRDEGASQHPRSQQQGRADRGAATTAGSAESEASDQRQRGLFA